MDAIVELVFSIVSKAVDFAQKAQAAKDLDHEQTKAALEEIDGQLDEALQNMQDQIAENNAEIDAELAAKAPKS